MSKRLNLSTSRDVRKAINRIANMLLNKQIDPRTANAILYACNVCLGAIRTDEQQARLEALEEALTRLEEQHDQR